jgi:hypothetical protein
MLDLELEQGSRMVHSIPIGMDTCMVYVYEVSEFNLRSEGGE